MSKPTGWTCPDCSDEDRSHECPGLMRCSEADTTPTVRKLLQDGGPTQNAINLEILAARVEAVLALEPANAGVLTYSEGWNICLAEVKRLLNGEKP